MYIIPDTNMNILCLSLVSKLNSYGIKVEEIV